MTYTAKQGAGAAGPASSRLVAELLVGPRYLADPTQGAASSVARLRADVVALPDVDVPHRPPPLFALLAAGSCLLAIAAGALVYLVLPRRAAPPDAEADSPTEPILTPLERALLLLERPARANGGADERRALELVAAVLVERGD